MRCTGQRCLVAIKDGEVLLCRLRAMSGRVASPARDWFPLCVRSVASNSVEGHHQGLGSRTFDGGPAPQRIERIEDLTIGDLLCEAARESGDRIALVDGVSDPKLRNRWAYTELLQQSERVAYALLTRFRPGDRIALCSPNCLEWIMLHYGIVLAGMGRSPYLRDRAPLKSQLWSKTAERLHLSSRRPARQ